MSALRQVADSQGTARVQLGGAMARETLRRMQEDALAAARSIGDDPAVQAALQPSGSRDLPSVLRPAVPGRHCRCLRGVRRCPHPVAGGRQRTVD